MSSSVVEVGDAVMHHGRLHTVTKIGSKAGRDADGNLVPMPVVTFENEGYAVNALKGDLRYHAKDGAWYLPGRVLARNERAMIQALTGSWPEAENHHAVRAMLDAVDLDSDISPAQLGKVLKLRKADVRASIEAGVDEAEVLDGYVPACISQCKELRAIRQARHKEVSNG